MIYGVLGMGLLLLFFGSVAILRGGAGLVRVLRLPRIVFSLFVASLAMSAPELSIAVQANIRGLPDIVFWSSLHGRDLLYALRDRWAELPLGSKSEL